MADLTVMLALGLFLGGQVPCGRAAEIAPEKKSMAEETVCTQHLQAMSLALEAYRHDHGELPPHLQDLFPQYIADPVVFHCPADPSPSSGTPPHPPIPVSYAYEMSADPAPADGLQLSPQRLGPQPTWHERKMAQRLTFGDRVPVVRCYHHGDVVLSLTLTGQVYQSQREWEFDPATVGVVLDRLAADLAAGPAPFTRNWDLGAIEAYFTLWPNRGRVLLIDTPLPPTLRYRSATVANRLSTDGAYTTQFPEIQQAEAFYRSLGPLKSFRPIERRDDGPTRTDRYYVRLGTTRWIQTFVLTHDEKIVALAIEPIE
jgi:hypothetical protein